ncbi:uncharacterized protein V1516DRAFT_670569 [Lipomyces oligophaga]|uniref:uncharacterized protein n=1 Tax=Lipomyces oligophaga TaxID=45792 RepID=UPI0034CE0DA6
MAPSRRKAQINAGPELSATVHESNEDVLATPPQVPVRSDQRLSSPAISPFQSIYIEEAKAISNKVQLSLNRSLLVNQQLTAESASRLTEEEHEIVKLIYQLDAELISRRKLFRDKYLAAAARARQHTEMRIYRIPRNLRQRTLAELRTSSLTL